MKNIKIGVLLVAVIAMVGMSSCKPSGGGYGKVTDATVAQFKDAIGKGGATLVDIRTPEEYNKEHIEGAILINWKKRTFRNYVLNLSQDKPILIYCRSGNRSGKAASALQALGYSNIINLNKGIKQWKIEGMPLVTEDSKANQDFQVKAKSTNNDVDAVLAKMAKGGLGNQHDVTNDDFKKALAMSGATLIDVRTQKEFDEGHIEGAKLIDWKQRSFKDLMGKINKDKPVLIYCRSGNRSGKAASTMLAMGFKEVYNLNKGIKGWKAANLPLAK